MSYDVRKAHPYLVYDRMEFEVPVGDRGDNYDRFNVRFQEMYQSKRIIEQALAALPEGPVTITDPKVVLPEKEKVYNSIEGLMNHFKLIMEGIHVPAGEVYQAVEGANGELGFYIVSDGSGRPYRVRVRPPCFLGHGRAQQDADRPHDPGHHHDLRDDQHDRRRVRPLASRVTCSPPIANVFLTSVVESKNRNGVGIVLGGRGLIVNSGVSAIRRSDRSPSR